MEYKSKSSSPNRVQPVALWNNVAGVHALRLRHRKKGPFLEPLFPMAEAEGFEPPWAFTQTVFKTASL